MTTELVSDFIDARTTALISSMPDIQRRIDRLNGVTTSSTGVQGLLSMLPGAAEGMGAQIHGSLAAVNRLGGIDDQNLFKVWFDARYEGLQTGEGNGDFVMSTIGADYLVTPRLLAGAFVLIENPSLSSRIGPEKVSGNGWLAGAYATAKSGSNVYLDGVVGGGASANEISPFGTYTDNFDTTRIFASTALSGDWKFGAWTLTPRAGLAYFHKRSNSYVDSLGVTIPEVSNSVVDVLAGPGVAYRYETADGTVLRPRYASTWWRATCPVRSTARAPLSSAAWNRASISPCPAAHRWASPATTSSAVTSSSTAARAKFAVGFN